jgi:drug/metabolite transporter (DMT)-like permease
MENRRKLLVAFLLIVGVVAMVYAVAENVEVGYPSGLTLLLLGSVFWLLAE